MTSSGMSRIESTHGVTGSTKAGRTSAVVSASVYLALPYGSLLRIKISFPTTVRGVTEIKAGVGSVKVLKKVAPQA